MAYSIFLSHASADGDWVRWIGANAKRIGLRVYLHEHDPQPGTALADKIKQAIDACDSLVVFLTQNAVFSNYVQQEVGYAEGKQKRIMPLVQQGIHPRNLAMLEGREYVPFDFNDPQRSLNPLLTYLQKLKLAKERDVAALWGFAALIAAAWFASRD